jgi:hypothetical protein
MINDLLSVSAKPVLIGSLFNLFFVISCFSFENSAPKVINPSVPISVNTGTQTLWGGVHRWLSPRWTQSAVISTKLTSLPVLDHPTITLSIRKATSPQADLIIFFPGIFGQPGSALTPEFISSLERLPFHILAVPNVLSESYLSLQIPYVSGKVFKQDAEVFDAIIKQVIKNYKLAPQKIHIIAESLGSYSATSWSALTTTFRGHVSSLTLLWPPLNLYNGMKRFDQHIQYYAKFKEHCSWPTRLRLMIKLLFLTQLPSADLSPFLDSEHHCAGYQLFPEGFRHRAQEVLNFYLTLKHRPQEKNLKGFEHFFSKYDSQINQEIQSQKKELSLSEWVNQAVKIQPLQEIIIHTSENDFLNLPQEWNTFAKTVYWPSKKIKFIPNGGHAGAMGDLKHRADLLDEIQRLSL